MQESFSLEHSNLFLHIMPSNDFAVVIFISYNISNFRKFQRLSFDVAIAINLYVQVLF